MINIRYNTLWLLVLTTCALAEVPYTLTGPIQQGSLIYGSVPAGTIVTLDERKVRVNTKGQFIIGFGRDAAQRATLHLSTVEGLQRTVNLDIKSRQYNIQRVEGVPKRTVTPDPKFLKRIKQESIMVGKARAFDSDLEGYLSTFSWPLMGAITGVYGSQRYYNGEPRRPHFGVDVAAKTGTLVKSPAPGVVRLVHKDMFFSGGTLVVDHGYGLSSSFIHLSDILVKEGETITQGQDIAKVGATGRATGPHLDWRMNWYEVKLDPQLIVGPMPDLP